MNLTILASGSKANSMLVSFDRVNIMIDAGLGYKQAFPRMLDAGIRPEDLTAILITHQHGDHVAGLPGIIGKLPDLPVYMTKGTFGAMKWGEFRRPRVMLFEAGSNFVVNGVEVRSFAVPHDAAEPCGYALQHNGSRFAMATDLGSITPEVAAGLSGADLVCLESNHDEEALGACGYPDILKRRIAGPRGHLSNAAVCEFIRDGLPWANRIVLTHLSDAANDVELCRMTALEAVAGRCELLIANRDGGMA